MARRDVGFPLQPDMGGDYGYAGAFFAGGAGAAGDQRHRAVLNGVWDIGLRRSAERHLLLRVGRTVCDQHRRRPPWSRESTPPRSCGCAPTAASLRVLASLGSRFTAFDMRLQKRLPLGPRVTLDGMFEVYNLFNHVELRRRTRPNESSRAIRQAIVQRQRGVSAADAAARIPAGA